MAERRVAITGLGVVSAAGLGAEQTWEAFAAARPCILPMQLFNAEGFACRIGGQLLDFSAKDYVPKNYRKSVKIMARDIEIAVVAADLAVRDAGLVTRGIDPDALNITPRRFGCNIGAGLITAELDELGNAIHSAVVDGKFDMGAWGSTGMGNLTPLWLLKYLPNMLSCHVTIIHGAEGPSNNITCGAASGHLSVTEGVRWIQRGDADLVIAGGAETKLVPLCMIRQELLGRVCTTGNDSAATACRPFDAAASGTVIGEGGALLILEDLERAVARGAKIYAEIAGAGAACDPAGMHVTEPTIGGLDRAARSALRDAKVAPDAVDLIVAHGTGVPAEDRLEAAAWQSALGDRAQNIPAWSITGAVGSTFAGAGAIELAGAALAIANQIAPATVNFDKPIDGCRMNFLRQSRQAKIDCLVSGAHTVGGQSAAVVLKRYQP